jgi:glyoxylase-like metal-dependent hydrolase (beta-lactamase superfamily II)
MTLDGTRTYLVGGRRVAVIDPGPNLQSHLDSLALALGGDVAAEILLTHEHPDHAAGADALAERVGAVVRSASRASLATGDRIDTDAGVLEVVATPGHAPDHMAFYWLSASAVFCGDLMLGGLDTALVAAPEGDLSDYLYSLERLRQLDPAVIYPTHGPPFNDPPTALDRYVAHRRARQQQILAFLDEGEANASRLTRRVYGESLPGELQAWLAAATEAYLVYLERQGQVERSVAGWRLRPSNP